MTENAKKTCPCCGQSMPEKNSQPAAEQALEYDHRGVQMPRRTRIGGIIIPQ